MNSHVRLVSYYARENARNALALALLVGAAPIWAALVALAFVFWPVVLVAAIGAVSYARYRG